MLLFQKFINSTVKELFIQVHRSDEENRSMLDLLVRIF